MCAHCTNIVICDIATPGMTGTEKQAAEEFPDIVFIMLTNHPDFQLAQHLPATAPWTTCRKDFGSRRVEEGLTHAKAE